MARVSFLEGLLPCAGELRHARGEQAGSEIDYLEVKTPEGRTHNLDLTSTQLRVPELECHDQLTLTYKGRLQYASKSRHFDANSRGVPVSSPEQWQKQSVLLGLTVAGGVQWYPGHQKGNFAPVGEAQAVLVYTPTGFQAWGVWKLDVRAGVSLAGRPYCYDFDRQGDICRTSHETIPYWRLYVEQGMTIHWKSGFRLELSAGPGHAFYFRERDNNKLQRDFLHGFFLTGRVAFGYELVRGITASLQSRFSYPEPIYGSSFDESGSVRYGPIDGSRWVLDPVGVALRFDDIL